MANTTALIQVRLDESVKRKADTLFADLGLDTPTAIRIFLNQSIRREGLPFEVARPKPKSETLALIERIESGEEELVGPFSSKEELWRSLGI